MTTSPMISRIRLVEAVLGALIFSMASVPFLQTHIVRGDVGDLEVRQEALKDIESNLQTISLNLLGFLEDHAGDHLERIKASSKEVTHGIVLCKEAAINAAVKDPKHIESRFEDVHEATLSILKTDTAERQTRAALEQTSQALLDVFSNQILPTIQPNQPRAFGRLEAALDAEAESQNLVRQTADSSRFHRAIATYRSLSDTRRSITWAQNAEQLFALAQSQNNDLATALQQKKASLERFTVSYRTLTQSLVTAEGGRGTTGVLHSSGVPNSLRIGLSMLLILTLLVMGFLDRQVVHQTVRPIQSLIQAAEAASSGDLSRTPDYLSQNHVGRLSTAVHRLITVLGRSENLVYHMAALVESSGAAIISQTLDGVILSWNKGAQRLYGYSADEVKGKPMAILAPGEWALVLSNGLDAIKRGDRPAPFEMMHQAKNGRSLHVLVRMAPILNSTRQVIGASFCTEEIPVAKAAAVETSASPISETA